MAARWHTKTANLHDGQDSVSLIGQAQEAGQLRSTCTQCAADAGQRLADPRQPWLAEGQLPGGSGFAECNKYATPPMPACGRHKQSRGSRQAEQTPSPEHRLQHLKGQDPAGDAPDGKRCQDRHVCGALAALLICSRARSWSGCRAHRTRWCSAALTPRRASLTDAQRARGPQSLSSSRPQVWGAPVAMRTMKTRRKVRMVSSSQAPPGASRARSAQRSVVGAARSTQRSAGGAPTS